MQFNPILERTVTLRVAFLLLLLCMLLTVAFGWAVLITQSGSDQLGRAGKAAVELAAFPSKARQVLLEVTSYLTGSYRDESIRVKRDQGADYSGFTPVPTASGIDVQGLLMRADASAIAPGWRLLIGAFTLGDDIENAALLMSPDLQIVKAWVLDEVSVNGRKPRPKHRKFIHGLEILDDESLIFAFDGGVSLQRIDRCGRRQWAVGGDFHHAVTLEQSGDSVWTFKSDRIAKVSVEDGTIVREIAMDDVIAENPMIDILELRRLHANDLGTNSRNTAGRWMAEQFHFNDVDPLPAAIADQFRDFEAGDLLVSARSVNLVFVIDPDTLEIKWWRVGTVQRQHDPDWLPSGEIMVFNNRMSREFSEIVSIDPATFRRTTLFDGRRNDFYTRIRGKQQMLETGYIVVTSPQQGRAFEVDRNGEVVFEIVNVKPGSATMNYVISELKWLPVESVNLEDDACTG